MSKQEKGVDGLYHDPIHESAKRIRTGGKVYIREDLCMSPEKVEILKKAAGELFDSKWGHIPGSCYYDHHGYCQEHGLYDRPCPVERICDILGTHD